MATFSKVNPDLQLAWDATSLKALQKCPRYYQYSVLDGRRGESVHLYFGGFLASALEIYQKGRVAGLSREDALLPAIRATLAATWETDGPSTQWGGAYVNSWHCLGETKYRNEKGNAAKCPYAHKGKWFDTDAPHICGECGSGVEQVTRYVAESPTKNRQTLLRALIWYALSQPAEYEKGVHVYTFPDGLPAIELSFTLPVGEYAGTGEEYLLAGHIDYIGEFGSLKFPVDNKTTNKDLNEQYFSGFSPDTQFDTYDMVVNVLFPDLKSDGTMVDAIKMGADGVEFGRRLHYKSDALRAEHMDDLMWWIRQAESMAERHHWPMNKASCWLCPFKKVCSMDPKDRAEQLDFSFNRGPRWDPLKVRN